MRFSTSSLFFFAALSLVACGGSPSDDQPADEAADSTEADIKSGKTVLVSASDDGKAVSVDAGQKVQIKLSSNASTGYVRMVKDVGGLADPKLGNIPGDVHRPGNPGWQTFTFETKGVSAGAHKIALI